MIKKLIAGGIIGLALLASTVPVLASGPYNAIPDQNPAFVDSGHGSIENMNNTELRFGSGGRIAIPGEGGQYSSDSSVVAPYGTLGSPSIVDPMGAF